MPRFPLIPKLLLNAVARVWIAYGSTPYGSGTMHGSCRILTCFFVIFASNLVPSCALDFSMSCRSSLVVLINRITMLPKSKSTFAPFELYPKTLANNVSLNSHVDHQTPKSKLNGSRVHFPYTGIGRWRLTKEHHARLGLARARLPILTNAKNSPLESVSR